MDLSTLVVVNDEESRETIETNTTKESVNGFVNKIKTHHHLASCHDSSAPAWCIGQQM